MVYLYLEDFTLLKAVLFDMDGVIIDSEPQHARAAVLALKNFNVNITIDYAYQFIGTTTYHMCQRMIEDFSIDATPEDLLQANEVMKDHLTKTEGFEAIPYIVELMKDLHNHGIKMIIASSSSGSSIQEVMKHLNIVNLLDGFISGTTVAHPKPAPDIFLAAASQLGVSPSECIVIEDSYNGVTAAAAAGIPSIGFLNPNSGKQDLSKAAILVEGFDEVDYNFIDMVYQHAYLQPATILTTDRLILRELALDDLDRLCEIYNKPGTYEYLTDYSGDFLIEKSKHKAYIKNIYHFYGYGLWGVFLKETNQLIGRCGIEFKTLDRETVYELGYHIDPDYQGLGYAMEATIASIQYGFCKLDMDRIVAVIDKNNTPSIELAKKIGMSQSGEVFRNQKEYLTYEIRRNDLYN
jgi:HAD superfamily hydrolase (TIGR01509 family)